MDGIKEQTKQSLLNMSKVLEASGSSLDKVVKTTVFLKDMNEFAQMNEVYSTVSITSCLFFCSLSLKQTSSFPSINLHVVLLKLHVFLKMYL